MPKTDKFGRFIEEPKSSDKYDAKMVNFAQNYGMSDAKLSEILYGVSDASKIYTKHAMQWATQVKLSSEAFSVITGDFNAW